MKQFGEDKMNGDQRFKNIKPLVFLYYESLLNLSVNSPFKIFLEKLEMILPILKRIGIV